MSVRSYRDDGEHYVTNDVVSDHVASIVFDGEEFEPECVLCQKAVGLGYFAHFGYELEPRISNPPKSVSKGQSDG